VVVYSAVVTTGIYCRPGCAARPLAHNTRIFDSAAAAEAAGFRACHRCRPYRTSSPAGSSAPEIVCEAVQLIIGGALDDGGTEAALAQRIGISSRHLRRLFLKHLGASPDQLARSRRAHFARRLLDDTDLALLDVAFASGFGSLRQFNRTMREVFRASPGDLRARRRRADRLAADGGLTLRLPVRSGYDWAAIRSFLTARALPLVETVSGDTYRRTITMAGAPGLIEVSPGGQEFLLLNVHLPYWEGLIHVVDRVGRLLAADDDHGVSIPGRGGIIVPCAWDRFEAGVWAILAGQPERDRLLEAFITLLGSRAPGLPDGLTHTFPRPDAVTPDSLRPLGLPEPETTAITALAATPLTDEPAVWTGNQWLALAAAHLMTAEPAASEGAGPGRPLPSPTGHGRPGFGSVYPAKRARAGTNEAASTVPQPVASLYEPLA
jgi:AraC family transcriptional regulator of adaptative response / DNA-3-methyladenine glycosylase II